MSLGSVSANPNPTEDSADCTKETQSNPDSFLDTPIGTRRPASVEKTLAREETFLARRPNSDHDVGLDADGWCSGLIPAHPLAHSTAISR